MKKVCLTLAASLLASFAQADTITIDPNGLAEGTNISNAYSGVTLRHYSVIRDLDAPDGAVVIADDVYVKECPTAGDPNTKCGQLGTGYFGYQSSRPGVGIGSSFVSESSYSVNCITGNPGPCKWSDHEFLDATFDAPVEAVTIDGTHLSDWPTAWAFDAAGNQLQISRTITWHRQCFSASQPGYCHQTLTVTASAGQISRVVFAGLGGYVLLDKLTYTVP